MLKADFHTHTGEDPYDTWIKYSSKNLIDHAARLHYDVLSITNHNSFNYTKKIAKYAKEKGILLIPGIEARINKKHVIILNATEEAEKLKSFSDLHEYKKRNPGIFILAAHPFYPKKISLGNDFLKNRSLFDGVEYCHYYFREFNSFNKKAVKKARKYGKPLVGNSDAHQFRQFNKTYSLVDSKKDIKSVIKALKEGKVKVKTRPLSYLDCARIIMPMTSNKIRRFLRIQDKY